MATKRVGQASAHTNGYDRLWFDRLTINQPIKQWHRFLTCESAEGGCREVSYDHTQPDHPHSPFPNANPYSGFNSNVEIGDHKQAWIIRSLTGLLPEWGWGVSI